MPKRIMKWPSNIRAGERAMFEEGVARLGLDGQSSLPRVVKGFADWLTWAEAHGQPRKPHEASLRRYGADLMVRMKSLSATTFLMWVKKACQIMWPNDDWRWLHRWCSELWKAYAPPHKPKPRVPRPSALQRGIPFREWPAERQKAWLAATARLSSSLSCRARYGVDGRTPSNRSRSRGKEPSQWRKDTRDSVIKGYGLFLAFCRDAGLPDEVTPDAVKQWIDHLDNRNLARRTTESYLAGVLAAVAEVFEPQRDWTWLAKDVHDLAADLGPPKRDKARKLVERESIWNVALALMACAELEPSLRRSAHFFRAGFMLAFLSCHPLRVTNFAGMLVGENVVLDKAGTPVRLKFPKTKTGRRSWGFARKLVRYWRRWWNWYRPFFPGWESSRAVWPGPGGKPIRPRGLRRHLFRVTTKIFGKSLYPHLFRDMLAKSLTERGDPEAARHLLGHKNLKALGPYIQSADSKRAARRVREILARNARRVRKPKKTQVDMMSP